MTDPDGSGREAEQPAGMDFDGTFIQVEVSGAAATDPELAKKLEEVCPVDIFKATDSGTEVVAENQDECVLCDLCLEAAPPGTVRVIKLYES